MHIKFLISIIEVFIAYFVLIIMLTVFMVKPIVGKRNIFERFVLYLVVGNFYIINIVFVLAYLNLFNRTSLVVILLIGSFLIRVLLDKEDAERIYFERKETFIRLIHGEYGKRLFLQNIYSNTWLKIKIFCYELFHRKKLEWIIFLSIMGYNVYYYGYNSISRISFAAPDEEVHLYWIQSLIGGHIFPSGVYPHGLHNILAAISVIIDLNAAAVVRAFGIISTVLIMTMLYFGLRKILRSRCAALFGFLAYSLLNIYVNETIYRFQFTIPQEYGMIMLMPMAIFAFDYLKNKRVNDLVLFGVCLSLTISIHFYITIIALALCFAIAAVNLYRILKNKLFVKILFCGILSVVTAIAPLAYPVAMGHKMEQSMDWAVRVIQGKEYKDDTEESVNQEKVREAFYLDEFLIDAKEDIIKYVFPDIRGIYILITLIGLNILYCIFLMLRGKTIEKNLYQLSFAFFASVLIFLILCIALKLPTPMEPKRVAIFLVYISPIYIAMPVELLHGLFSMEMLKKVRSAITFAAIPALIYIAVKYNLVRPLLPSYYFQTTGAMLVDWDIINKYNDYQWTIVSPENDRNVIFNNGYHYELSDFVRQQENWNEKMKINIPSKYIFIYIEKRPIVNVGYVFYKGDKELVNRKLVTYLDAQIPLEEYRKYEGKGYNPYYREGRQTLMSKAYYWALKYKEYFPKEMSVYYEDDELIVYRIEQNEYGLNNFAINYGANEIK